jgi:O-antigen ligase
VSTLPPQTRQFSLTAYRARRQGSGNFGGVRSVHVIQNVFDSRLPVAGRTLAPLAWTATGAIAAFTIAFGVSSSPTNGIVVAVAVAAGVSIVVNPAIILVMLAASVLIEQVRVEGASISRVLAPIALLTVLLQLMRGRAFVRAHSPLMWAVAYAVWALASGLWTLSASGTVVQLSSLAIALIYMLSFATLLDSLRDLERALWALVVASLLLGALSFPQVSSALHQGQLLQGGRSQGGTGDPNYFAATQLVVLPLVVVLAAEARRRWLQLGLYAVLLVIIGSVLTSLSRGGFIGLAVLLVLLVVAPFHLLFRSRRNKAIAVIVIAVGVTALSIQFSSTLVNRAGTLFETTNPATQGSGRLELWKAAWASVHQRPWLGLGYGGFPARSEELLLDTPGVDLSHYELRAKGQPAHNTYLGSLVDLGILGPTLYLGLLISTGLRLRRAARQAREARAFFLGNIAGALLLGLVTWSITSIFLSTETARTFWIIIGLSIALPKLLALGDAQDKQPLRASG